MEVYSVYKLLVMLSVDLVCCTIPTKIIPSPVDIEVVSVNLLVQHSVKLYLVYNPPNSGKIYQQKLVSFLSDIMQSYNNIVILGDFNALDIDWSTLRVINIPIQVIISPSKMLP